MLLLLHTINYFHLFYTLYLSKNFGLNFCKRKNIRIPAYHNVNLNLHFDIKSTAMINAILFHISSSFLFRFNYY